MPTIAELLAAKGKAKQTKHDDTATREAIDRIDPPGKRVAGIVLSKSLPGGPEPRGQRTPVMGPEDLEPEPRSLSRTAGEAIDMTPVKADNEVETWHAALNAFESSLCVMRDPKEPDVIWLAVRPDREGLPPLLVHRLPWVLWNHPQEIRPDNEPF
jgi:hypothetical protein